MTETQSEPKIAFYILSTAIGFNYACRSQVAVIASKARHKAEVDNYELTAFTPPSVTKRLVRGGTI